MIYYSTTCEIRMRLVMGVFPLFCYSILRNTVNLPMLGMRCYCFVTKITEKILFLYQFALFWKAKSHVCCSNKMLVLNKKLCKTFCAYICAECGCVFWYLVYFTYVIIVKLCIFLDLVSVWIIFQGT